MKFVRTAKNYQLVIKDGNDLKSALLLDEALWVAVSAPISDYTCDAKFLEYVNLNKSRSISSEEVKKAIQWLLDVYPHPEKIDGNFDGKQVLDELSDSDAAKIVRHSADYINKDLSCADPKTIDLETVREFQKKLTTRPLNGDGVISTLAATVTKDANRTADMDSLVKDVAAATGGSVDLDGTTGMTQAQFQSVWDAIPGYLAWKDTGKIPAGKDATDVMVMGAQTPDLLTLLDEHAPLVDEFFKLCALRKFDQRFEGKVLESDGKPAVIDPTAWPGIESHLKAMPICQPTSGTAEIPVGDLDYINPLYREWWGKMANALIRPVLGGDVAMLTPAGWAQILAKLAPFRAYLAAKPTAMLDAIPEERLRHYVSLTDLPELVDDLTKRDVAVADILKEAAAVEQLLLYRALLVPFCNNFVNFLSLYEGKCDSLVNRGRIVIDGRWFNSTYPVNDIAAHAALASQSNLFIIYFEVETLPKPTNLCAPVTIGDKGCLVVGKRGIYFDRNGKEYNAKIVKVIENPVCIKEALLAPFTKAGKMIEDKVAAMSNASQTAIEGQMASTINNPEEAAKKAAEEAKEAANKPKPDKGNMMMGLGVMFAALSSAVAFICKTFSSMSWVSIVVSIVCVLAVLLLPISLLAILKLRRQDLSMLLEGNGWALNKRLKLTFWQRRRFSRGGIYPDEALGTPKRRCRAIIAWILIIIILACAGYTLHTCMKGKWRSLFGCKNGPCNLPPCELVPAPAEAPAAPAEAAPAAEAPAPAAE